MTTLIHAVRAAGDVLVASTVPMRSRKIDWGAAPDWLAAIGALLNLVFLGVALLREIRLRRIEEDRRTKERRDLEARHARRVSVAVREASGLQLDLEVANNGEGPIFDIIPGVADSAVRTKVSIKRIDAGQISNASVGSTSVLRDDMTVVPTVTFTDVDGLRWSRTGSLPPQRQLAP